MICAFEFVISISDKNIENSTKKLIFDAKLNKSLIV